MKNLKIILLALLTMIFAQQIFAQQVVGTKSIKLNDNDPTGYIVAGGGIGIPLGEYRYIVLDDSKSGFAQNGFNSFIEFAMPIAKSKFGFAANIGYYNNSIDNISVGAQQTAQANNGATYVLTADNYKLSTVLAGVYITIPIQRFSIDFKGLAGVSLFTYPAQTINSFYNGQTGAASSEVSTTAAFAYGGNVTVRFAVVKHFCLLVQTGVIHTDPNYSGTFINPVTGASSSFSGDQPITILYISGGLGFQF